MIVTLTLSDGSLAGLAAALERTGFGVRSRPLVRFAEPESWEPLDRALASAHSYAAMALTSPRAASRVARRLAATRRSLSPDRPSLWTVSSGTAALLPAGTHANLPTIQTAAGLARAMVTSGLRGPILYPCGDPRRPEFADLVREAGNEIDEIVCYVALLADRDAMLRALQDTDLVVVASHRVLEALAGARTWPRRAGLVCLGEATARTARGLGWAPVAVATAPTVESVLDAVRGATASSIQTRDRIWPGCQGLSINSTASRPATHGTAIRSPTSSAG